MNDLYLEHALHTKFEKDCSECFRAEYEKTHPSNHKRNTYKVDINGCWIWQGANRGNGYGFIHLHKGKGGLVSAHRYYYELRYGKIPSKMYVCHKCDVKKCVNPEHLFLGTANDNIQDMVNKKRQPKAESCGKSKLNWKEVNEIRKICATKVERFKYRLYKELGKKYGVHESNINSIVENKTWKLNHEEHNIFNENCPQCFSENLRAESHSCISCGIRSYYSSCDRCMKIAEETDCGI